MPDVEKKMWGIHTLDDNLFLKEDVIAIGWKEIGNLRDMKYRIYRSIRLRKT